LLERRLALLGMEHASLKREEDSASRQRLEELDREIAAANEQHLLLKERWQKENEQRQELTRIKQEREALNAELERMTQAGSFEAAAEIKNSKLPELAKREQHLLSASGEQMSSVEVGEDDIAAVVSRATGIPAVRMLGSERKRLLGMAKALRGRVLDQDAAVDAVAAAVLRSRTGIADPNRPIGSFLFLGPTGVGKTELAKATADFMFGSDRQMVRIDMSEYGEKHSVARLIGAPPGYVGYEEGGQLTEAVRRRPYSVILLDELEKAHPDIFNILLQVLDEGRLTDGQGRTVDFRNTVLVLTSNLGSGDLSGKVDEEVRAQVLAQVRAYFKPEFLNRLDEILVFNGLGKKIVGAIARMQLDLLVARLARQKYNVQYSPQVVETLAEAGFDPSYGARPLKRSIQSMVETPLAEAVLSGKWEEGCMIRIAAKAGKITFDFPAAN
ncbi:MAG: AAA family ATPase, partial [Betaproteobacteria bacterium]|nr:AAA family ATPase [Betaproteobacteria bacterium]